ncbi:hypothetical protein E4U38_006127 [Claviceps purpurea]|nr:hypothetical protein E4U38_006127 [Claviceps purpurea]KAG6158334.1 hypothetical protein E4U37_006036 [Claviceps purpurea]
MAPKSHYAVHSLSKHIEDTQKGLTADAQYNKRPSLRSAVTIKQEPASLEKSIFGDNGSSDDDSSSSGSSDEGDHFLRNITSKSVKASNATSKQNKDDEIADSDDERKAAANKTASGSKMQSVKRENSSEDEASDDSESEAGSEPETSEKQVAAGGQSLKPAATSGKRPSKTASAPQLRKEESESDSNENEAPEKREAAQPMSDDNSSEGESDAEEDEDEEVLKPAAVSQVNGSAAHITSDASSGEEHSDDEEAEKSPVPVKSLNKKTPVKSSNKKTPVKPSSKTVEQPPSAQVSDESSSEASHSEDADESMHMSDRKHDSRVALPNFITRDFTLCKSEIGANGQDVARICSEANLQGKQVWYFTVPANVPISVVQNMEIPMNQSNRDDRVFSHDDEDYGISFDSMVPKSSIQILIPSADGVQYQSAPKQINQVMHVKKIAQLGRGNLRALPSEPAPKEPCRAQPKGMKLRYQPFGVNTGMGQIGGDEESDIDVDVDMVDAPAAAVPPTPAPSKADKKDKKKKQSSQDVDTARKGKRKLTSEDEAAAAAEQLQGESQSAAKVKSKKQKTQRTMSPDLGSDGKTTSTSSNAKKVTPVLPPNVPSSQTVARAAASTPASKLKNKIAKSETPVSVPRQSVVPIPVIPGSSQPPKVSPVPIPQPIRAPSPLVSKDSKKAKAKKEKKEKSAASTTTTRQSPPPSAQSSKRASAKVTPVPPPKLRSMS